MYKKHVQKHNKTTKHQNYVKSNQNSCVHISNTSLTGPSYQYGPTLDHNLWIDVNETYNPPRVANSHQTSESIHNVPMDDLEPLWFSDLLGSTFGDHTYIISEAHDYFQEAIDILQNGEHQFTFSRPLNLRGKELGLETEEGSFGREDGKWKWKWKCLESTFQVRSTNK
jgi:hypothetical protein